MEKPSEKHKRTCLLHRLKMKLVDTAVVEAEAEAQMGVGSTRWLG